MKKLYTILLGALLAAPAALAATLEGTFTSSEVTSVEMEEKSAGVYEYTGLTVVAADGLEYGELLVRTPFNVPSMTDYWYYHSLTASATDRLVTIGEPRALHKYLNQSPGEPWRSLQVPVGTYDVRFEPDADSGDNGGCITFWPADQMPASGEEEKTTLYIFGSIDRTNYDSLTFFPMQEIPAGSGVWYIDNVKVTTNGNGDHYVSFTFDNSAAGQNYRGQIAGYGAGPGAVKYANSKNPEAINPLVEFSRDIDPFALEITTYETIVVDLNNMWVRFVADVEGTNPDEDEETIPGVDEADLFIYYTTGVGAFYRGAMTEISGQPGVFRANGVTVKDYYGPMSESTGALVRFGDIKMTGSRSEIIDGKHFYGPTMDGMYEVWYGTPDEFAEGNVTEFASETACNYFNIDPECYDIVFDRNSLRTWISLSEDVALDTVGVEAAEAPAAYFTLQGVRVERPSAGAVYVRVQGGKAAKVAL